MANDGINKRSLRIQDVVLNAGQVTAVYFGDTKPNILQIKNNTAGNIYYGLTPNVGSSYNEDVAIAGTVKKYTDVLGLGVLYIYADNSGSAHIKSMESFENYGNELSETQVVVLTSAGIAPYVQIANGADVTLGSTGDLAQDDATLDGSVISFLKGLLKTIKSRLPSVLTGGGGVKVGIVDSLPVGANVVGGVTVADGDMVSVGAIGNAKVTSSVGGTLLAMIRGVLFNLEGILTKVGITSAGALRMSTVVNLTTKIMTLANTEYSYTLLSPTTCHKLSVYIEDGDGSFTWTFAFASGVVTTANDRLKLLGGSVYNTDAVNMVTPKVLYFACSTAGRNIIIEEWGE